jgi:hypothetical protein
MNADNDVSRLFRPPDQTVDSPEALEGILEDYGSRHLVYPRNGFPNVGYIFRGEIGFDVPLQPSLERAWFDAHREEFCSMDKLLSFEKSLVEGFMEGTRAIRDLATMHFDKRPELPLAENVVEWLQFMQHYRTKTRFLDFTREIHFALYFALEHYCQKRNENLRHNGLIIYCFPCIDVEDPKTGGDNKTPFHDPFRVDNKDCQPDMNLAIGGQIGLECMNPHKETFDQHYCLAKQKQSFGWDRAYHPNPRLSFQKGMLAYPYRKEGVSIKKGGPSWFVQCLRMDSSDPFHMVSTKESLRPVMIRIPEGLVSHCLEYIQRLPPAKVYLDYGRVGDRLQPERSHAPCLPRGTKRHVKKARD